jgi:phage nucleotide-binding protein
MSLNFTSTSQVSNQNGIKILVYGTPGVGKTALVATLPKPILISAEAGALSLRPQNIARIYGANNPDITYDIPMIEIKTVQDLKDAYQFLATDARARQFDSVAIDSISEIGETVLANAKEQVKDGRQAYMEVLVQMEMVVRLFRDLPRKHVYFSAKTEPVKDELSGAIKYGISMPGAKLGHRLPYFFDEVYRLGIDKDNQGQSYRYLQTQPDYQFDAKSRSGALASKEPPNLTSIIRKILGD